MQTWCRYGGTDEPVNNFEVFLTQRESEGATTQTNNRAHGKDVGVAGIDPSHKNIFTAKKGTSVGFAFQSGFISSNPASLCIKVTFYDEGNETFELKYNSGLGSKTASKSHVAGTSGAVKTVSFYIDDLYKVETGNTPDFYLESTGGNVPYIMVRTIKLLK
jgi:hypothetical protein